MYMGTFLLWNRKKQPELLYSGLLHHYDLLNLTAVIPVQSLPPPE